MNRWISISLALLLAFCMAFPVSAKEVAADANPAEVQAEEEFDVDALIAEASKLAYQDLKSASPEMQEKILEARAQIMYNTDWIADGCEGGTFDIKTGEILSTLPHFSEVFPEDWEPPVDKSMEQWAENPSSPVLDEPGVQLPKLPGLSSTAETIVEEPIHFPNIPGNVGIAFPS